ncbi:histidine kinase [Winogradskyella sp. F6397]|uniref:Histidine kinase n=1 Tax=Winogradskyella marina TaxID=2785530 RepID=A0ABS0EDT1_9FLAO|nr:histidine kinase [Winogradskyella marina]MBF8148588.1 histidine kinase [Winogradskyella marina]
MKTLTLIICYFSFGVTHLFGQIMVDSIQDQVVLIDHKNVTAINSSLESSIEDIKTQTNWKPYNSSYIPSSENSVWLKFKIQNRSKDTVINHLFSRAHYTTIYISNNNGYKKIKNGFYVPTTERNQSESFNTKLIFLPFQESQVYIKLSVNKTLARPIIPKLYSEISYLKSLKSEFKIQTKPIGFIYFYIISLITILIFSLVFLLRMKERLYFYYFGYLFFQLIYGFLTLRNTLAPLGRFFDQIPKLAFDLIEPIQFIFIAFYIFFVLLLLKVKEYDKLLAKILIYLGLFCLVFALTRFSFSHFIIEAKFTDTLFLIIRAVILPINIILLFWIIYKVKHPLLPYFVIGQSFFFIGAIVSSYVAYSGMNLIPGHFLNFKESPNIIFQIGLLIEVYCFSLALGKNVFVLQEEKEKATTKFIEQLEKNREIQETMNRELDGKVNEKTFELLQLYSEIEEKKEQQTKDNFTKRIRETEIVALRSQMNPHFIFNSMNAIKNLIMTSRNDDAINYLDNFSTLLREILQNSNRKKITVEEELEILELYLSLEKSRIKSGFNFNIEVTSKEALSQYQIPPLLLQPIVENAIWHGLHPSLKPNKKLTIIFDTTEDLKIIIEDNGIGRKESSKKKKLNDSMGSTIVQDRLTLYNHVNDHNIIYKITDLEVHGNSLGTKITLTYEY